MQEREWDGYLHRSSNGAISKKLAAQTTEKYRQEEGSEGPGLQRRESETMGSASAQDPSVPSRKLF